ncbi:MAG: hypothetical protein KKE51_13770 [Gammaproteobacteria bacterium]|nr:hypothetical protein [Gammaproteobacteria bacterium]MBU1601775.1 hypothetical protein [Gammaproteobacteria bacterium]MBU2432147.1 hypothetical protein [Gammaproteobacteria bacterium]MBU2450460.1 hypothetical protein [Gammaproteobacteria bacterium]
MTELSADNGDLGMAVRVQIGTGAGRLPQQLVKVDSQDLTASNGNIHVAIEIPGECLSTVLDLFTEIIVTSGPSNASLITPSSPGDRLWQDRLRIRIEGVEPRFPIEVTDFQRLLGHIPAAESPWYLHWSPQDWSRDFHGAIRLFLNRNSEQLIERFEQQDGPTLQALLADIMSQVCERFVADHDDQGAIDAYESGTLGAQATAWLQQSWPGRDFGFTRSLLQNRPGEFRSAFLALAETREVT